MISILNVIIIALVLVGLTVHRYLSFFWEQNKLPCPMGFNIFVSLFLVIYLTGFIWMFGVIFGVIIAILCFFQVIYSAFLWVFLLPYLIGTLRGNFSDPVTAFMFPPEVNLLVYRVFSYLVVIVGVLVVINFFVSQYKSLWVLFGDNYWPVVLVFLGVLVVGNLVRIICLRLIAEKG